MEEVSQSGTNLSDSFEEEKHTLDEDEEASIDKIVKNTIEDLKDVEDESKDESNEKEEEPKEAHTASEPKEHSDEEKQNNEEREHPVDDGDDEVSQEEQKVDEVSQEERKVDEVSQEEPKDNELGQEEPKDDEVSQEEQKEEEGEQEKSPVNEVVEQESTTPDETKSVDPQDDGVEREQPSEVTEKSVAEVEENELEESKADEDNKSGEGGDHDETIFEEVDANVSSEKATHAEESDMLGESDMTFPKKDTSKDALEEPMEVDSLSNDDVEMTSVENEQTPAEKEKERVPVAADDDDDDEEHEPEKESPTESNESPAKEAEDDKMEEDAEENIETTSTTTPEGKDVVDDGGDHKDGKETDEPTDIADLTNDEESPQQTTDKSVDKEVHEEEEEEEEDEESNKEATEKDAEDDDGGVDNDTEMAEDEPESNVTSADASTSAAREDDVDPDASQHVENVQEPEESDVCLIPDTETEVTDAEKEQAIQARETADKENEAAEAAAEAEAEATSAAEKEQPESTQEETPQEQEQEPLLEEMQPPGHVEGGTVQKIIIFLAVSVEKSCAHCKEDKICGYRYKDAESGATQYLCKTGCIDTLLTTHPGRYFIRRKKFLVEEAPETENTDEHECLVCKKSLVKNKYFFKQEDETFYICTEDCYKTLSSEEPEKFNLKRDSIRVRNIGHTTISAKGSSSSDSRIVARSAQEAEAAKVERTKSFLRVCTDCKSEIQVRPNGKNLMWQTMDFCDETCLGKYQRRIGSNCQTCNGEVPHQSLGKYCVRFGFEVRQFCCAACLNNFKKGLKTCSCCQKDISGSGEGFLAPVGDKEQFKDFCSQACMRRYDSMVNAKKKQRTDRCGVCNFEKLMRVEITIDGNEHNFCSNPCFSAFKFVSNIVPDQCGMCSKYFERKSSDCYTIYGEKQRPKVFCSRICFNVYIIVNRQITSCQWCKVKKYDFDMIVKLVDPQNPLMMCSLNCLTLYGVSLNAFSRAAVKCDNCNSCTTPQYHLTMSDGSMRNFCTYQCVMQFQSQFARVPLTLDSEAVACATQHVSAKPKATPTAPFPTGLPKRVKLNAAQAKTTTTSSSPPKAQQTVMPVISNVASLASGQSVAHSTSTLRRGSSRGRGRGRKVVNERPPPTPSPPPSPAPAPVTRTRTTASPAPAPAPTQALTTSSNKSTRGGRNSSRSTGTHTPTDVQRPLSPIIQKEVETKIVTVPPYPPLVRNVQTSCQPKTEDASIDCRPETAEIGIQTDEDYSTRVLIPVPVPIFVPQPMYMYSAPFPMPIPIPLPIPVPIFIPTTRNSSNGILKEIKKIQDKMPADPFEAELLMMAEMVADEKNESDSDSEEEMKPEPRMIEVQYQNTTPTVAQTNNVVVNMEAQNNSSFGEDVLQMALKMASGEYEEPGVDLESAMTANTITNPPPGMIHPSHVQEDSGMQMGHHMMMEQTQRGGRGRKRGAIASPITPRNNRSPIKRQRLSVDSTPPQQPVMPVEKPDANMCLKFTFGVNAWKQWVMTKNADIEKSSIRRRLFKTELLQMTADELNYSLCLFVKEVRKPNGTEYAPDTIYYLVLGIQQYLYENGRIDNIFTDPYYERFTDCLDEVARKFSVLYNDSQYIVTRVEEEHLWECKQLGAHSPHVLLSTLMFFNTKHFNLTNVEEHMQLSFSHIMKHWKRSAQNTKSPGTRNVLLRFYPPQAGLDANPRKKKVYEQQENEENPLRCPVRLYEFYLSKCPESVKTRNDVFYLQPERSCVPDSPVWYSTQALSEDNLQKMLHRVKMVKEINIALLTS
ncbi:zinc finger MYM-type protein 4 [Eupeodes corollae]|uniref:zinc finger MYM-type protein 4 n=1 Tax=Eupeodes corollae TaxID=290404 RepID=UPI00249031B0|nr:zinc finger MYM-type protein 4 [Eupeodes corollae]